MGMSITSQKNFNIMSAKEKEAAAKQTFTFLAPLTNEQSCEADIYFSCAINERTVVRSRTKECDKHGFVSIG